VAFLLSQLGHRSASVFADLITSIDLTPPHSGILRAIASEPGRSQQALSGQLGLLPSRVVAYVDELEERGYVERRRNPDDLDSAQRDTLRQLLSLVAEHQDMTPHVHPGFRNLGRVKP
jgi:DNA-binding MarR family transcriptional regulator